MTYFGCFYTGDVTWVDWNEGIWSDSRDVIYQVHWLYFINGWECMWRWWPNTSRPIQDGHYFSDDILKWIFSNENLWISIEISLKLVPRAQLNIPALVQIMVWHRPGDRPLFEAMIVYWRIHAPLGLNELSGKTPKHARVFNMSRYLASIDAESCYAFMFDM